MGIEEFSLGCMQLAGVDAEIAAPLCMLSGKLGKYISDHGLELLIEAVDKKENW